MGSPVIQLNVLKKLLVGNFRSLDFYHRVQRNLHLRHLIVTQAEHDGDQASRNSLVNDQEVVAILEVDALQRAARALQQVHVALPVRVAVVQLIVLARLVFGWKPTWMLCNRHASYNQAVVIFQIWRNLLSCSKKACNFSRQDFFRQDRLFWRIWPYFWVAIEKHHNIFHHIWNL